MPRVLLLGEALYACCWDFMVLGNMPSAEGSTQGLTVKNLDSKACNHGDACPASSLHL